MGFNFGDFVLGLDAKVRRAMPVATRRAYAPALPQGQIFSSVKPPVTPAGAVAGLTGATFGRLFTLPAIYEQGRKVFNPKENIVTELINLGSGLNNLVQGRPYLEGRNPRLSLDAPRLSQFNPPGFDPSQPVTTADVLKTARGVFGTPTSAPATGFDAGSPAERAYQAEKSRVAQLTAQDPAFKTYPVTPQGQFERYYQSPEFNYVFGAQTGKGPKTAEEMSALGAQASAPTTSSLPDFYRAQSAMGRVNQAEIQKMYEGRPDLQAWAAANPGAAQREYLKQQEARPLAADQANVIGDLGTRAQAETGYDPAAYGLSSEKIEEMKKKLLEKAGK